MEGAENSGYKDPSRQASICRGLQILFYERRNKDEPNGSLCEDLHVGISQPEPGEAARSSCYFSAKFFSKAQPFRVQKPSQVMPDYLHCAPCKNTLRGDWTCPMNYTLFIIIEPSFFRHALELWAGAVFNTLFILGEENVFL